MDFEFTQRSPTGRLARYVESVWHARGQIAYARERIAPTGSTVAGVVLGPPIRQTADGRPPFLAEAGFLIGPHDRPLLNEPTAETHCVGIVTTPVGCRARHTRGAWRLAGPMIRAAIGRTDSGQLDALDRELSRR